MNNLTFDKLRVLTPRREDSRLFYEIYFIGIYDKLLKGITRSDVVLDLGANIGIFTLAAAVRAQKVIAVEPHPLNFEFLKKNVELNKLNNVVLVNKAVADYDGFGFISGEGVTAFLSHVKSKIKVEVSCLDNLLRYLKVNEINLAKVDIEGSEASVLLTSGSLLQRNMRAMCIETHGKENYKAVYDILSDHGFSAKEFRFSWPIPNIIKHFPDYIIAESKTNFMATRRTLGHLLGGHPLSLTDPNSDIKILYALRTQC